jgi:hypothetical protein
VSSGIVNYTKTYDITITPTKVAELIPVNVFSGIIDIDLSDKTILPVMSWRAGWSTTWGTKLQEPTINNSQGTLSAFFVAGNCFYLEGYIAASGGEFPKPQLAIAESIEGSEGNTTCSDRMTVGVSVTKLDIVNDRIYFKISEGGSFSATGKTLSNQNDKISITVIINA